MNCWSHINENYLLNPTSICLYHFCIWLLLQHWKHNEQWQFRSDKWRTVDCFSLVPLISTPEILACCERFQRDANANDFSVMRTRTILAWCERERFCWHNYFLKDSTLFKVHSAEVRCPSQAHLNNQARIVSLEVSPAKPCRNRMGLAENASVSHCASSTLFRDVWNFRYLIGLIRLRT
jgi:hypothetical protein